MPNQSQPHSILLRDVPAELRGEIQRYADRDRRTQTSQILWILEEYVRQEQAKEGHHIFYRPQ